MKICTGRAALLEPAMIEALRGAMDGPLDAHIVVVPKQLTLQTERALLQALGLEGSFALQILSPERLCARIFEQAGQPDGVRVDERGRVMLVRQAVREAGEKLSLYRGAENRRGFADRCARQLELLRQARLSPEDLSDCARRTDGLLAMKLRDLSTILAAYERRIEGRFQDGETEFNCAADLAGDADFLRSADVTFFGFDITPPTLHRLMAAVAAVSPETRAFLPLENDEDAGDFMVFEPMKRCLDRLTAACRGLGVPVERVAVQGEAPQAGELRRLSRELFAFPAQAEPSDAPPKRIQLAAARNPMEECLFAAALCRRLARLHGWRWNDMLILCRDADAYRQPIRDAFRAYDVPVFLSSSRPAARHALAECLTAALRLVDARPRTEDAMALMRTGFMPISEDEADRLANFIAKYGLRPYALMKPLKRGNEAERAALEPIRARFAAPLVTLKGRLRRADGLRAQLTALFGFLEDIRAAKRLEDRLTALSDAGLWESAGEAAQVWNRVIGALDQMAALMGDVPLPLRELRDTLSESLEAAVIKPLPQSDDAVYAQSADTMPSRRVKALIILGETDRAGADPDGLFNAAQLQQVSGLTERYIGPDDAELSMLRRFYLKAAVETTTDYLCVCWPLTGMDGASQHPGALVDLMRSLFPGLHVRGGVTGDSGTAWMLRAAPGAAVAHAARALSAVGEGAAMPEWDSAALSGLYRLSEARPGLRLAFDRVRSALNHGEAAARLDPANARALYGDIQRQSVTRLERYAMCPFAYFTQYGLRPERIEPYALNPRDEGTFFHQAVQSFLQQSMDDLSAIDIPEAERRMDLIADALLDEMARQGPLGATATALAERRRLKATARTCAGVLAEHMRGSKFAPAALEADFGREDGPALLTADAASGPCALEGRIDRIDEWAEGGYLRVIDYKRGGRALELDGVYHGLSLQLPVYLAAAMRQRGRQSAGVYYFTLDEGIIAMQDTDKSAVEAERRKSFRLDGLLCDDVNVLTAQSPNFQEVLNARFTKGGIPFKDVAAAGPSGFQALTDHALRRAGEWLDDMRGGGAAVAPARFRERMPCAWCDLRPACLFDERLDADRVRRFKKIKNADALQRIILEHNDDRREDGR